MGSQEINLLITFEDAENVYFRISSKGQVELSKTDGVKCVKIDSENQHCKESPQTGIVQCRKCQETMEINLFWTEEPSSFKEDGTSTVKTEPIIEIKKEEMEFFPDVDETEAVNVTMDMENDFFNFGRGDDQESDYSDPPPRKKPKPSSRKKKILHESLKQEATFSTKIDPTTGQQLYSRRWGTSEEVVTNFQLAKGRCDICGIQRRRNASYPDFLDHRASHFLSKVNDQYNCLGCGATNQTIHDHRIHTRICPGKETLINKFKSGEIQTPSTNTSKRLNIPKGIVLPDLSKMKLPYFICVDQSDGTKIYVEKTKNMKGTRISNFDTRNLVRTYYKNLDKLCIKFSFFRLVIYVASYQSIVQWLFDIGNFISFNVKMIKHALDAKDGLTVQKTELRMLIAVLKKIL